MSKNQRKIDKVSPIKIKLSRRKKHIGYRPKRYNNAISVTNPEQLIVDITNSMSLEDMLEAAKLTEQYLKGATISSLSPISSNVKEYLSKIEENNKKNTKFGAHSLAQLNKCIVIKNELVNSPTKKTKEIYKDLSQIYIE